jgi:hypothetical protein
MFYVDDIEIDASYDLSVSVVNGASTGNENSSNPWALFKTETR